MLEAVCDRVVVAGPPGEELPGWVTGGGSRSESVRNALATAPESEIVVVHDAARPLVTPETIRRSIDEVLAGADGAIAAAPVTDTIKEAAADGRVLRTLERRGLWAVQTPQTFRADLLRRALDVDPGTLASATDDAALVEAAGGSVRVVEAPADNIKVTRPLDLRLAEALLLER